MNTVKRWLAGILSFAMIFTSSAFANVGMVYAGEVQKGDAGANVKVTIGTTVTYWESLNDAVIEVNRDTGTKARTIELLKNNHDNGNVDVEVPVTFLFNGYKFTGTAPAPDESEGICRGAYSNNGVITGYSYAEHKTTREYHWGLSANYEENLGTNPLDPIWEVKSAQDVCANCGSDDAELPHTNGWNRRDLYKSIYNDELKQYEYYEGSVEDYNEYIQGLSGSTTSRYNSYILHMVENSEYLKSTMSAEGYVITEGPSFVMDGSKVRHDEKGKPVVDVTIVKAADGSEVENPDVTLFDPDAAQMANNILYDPNGISVYAYCNPDYRDEEGDCSEGGHKAYGLLVKDPDGKELLTTYIVDNDLPKKSHEKGKVVKLELLTKVDDFGTEGAAREWAQLNGHTIEKIEKYALAEPKPYGGRVQSYAYRYWYFAEVPDSAIVGDDPADTTFDVLDLTNAITDNGTFTYRPVYECIYGCGTEIVGKEVVVSPLPDEKTAADHAANAEAMSKAFNPAPTMSTCEIWYYAPIKVGFNWIKEENDKELKKHNTYTYCTAVEIGANVYSGYSVQKSGYDVNRSGYSTHKAPDEISVVVSPTCYEEGVGSGACVICGKPIDDWEIEKLTDHDPKTGGKFEGDIDRWTANQVDSELFESHKLEINAGGSAYSTVLTVYPTCTERGGKYKWCTRNGGHWYLVEETAALGHELSSVVTVGDGTGQTDSFWCRWIDENYDEDNDYIFYANQKCTREDDMYMTVRYHSVKGENTETDKYEAVKVKVENGGKDCVTPAKTIYTVPALTDSKTKKEVKIEFINNEIVGPHNVAPKSFKWTEDFEKATAVGTCTICKAENKEAEAVVTKATTADGITTFTATHNGVSESKKAFTLKGAVVTFDASLITDGNLVDPTEGAAQQVPDVTVTINGTVIDPSLYETEWAYSPQKKWAIAVVDWTEAVKKSGKATYVPGIAYGVAQVDAGKLFNKVDWKYDLNGVEKNFNDDYTVYADYDPANTYTLLPVVIPEDATVKYAVLDKPVEDGKDYQERIEALIFDEDEVVIHNSGEYYVYAQITKDGYTTYTTYAAAFIINRPEIVVQIDDLTITVGEDAESKLVKRAYEYNSTTGKPGKAIVVDWAEDFVITTVGGKTLKDLDAGVYKLNVQAPNYSVTTTNETYIGTLTVKPKDDATVAAEKVAEDLKNAKTDDELAAAYEKFLALNEDQQKIVKADNAAAALLDKAKAAKEAADQKKAAEKELADAKTAANNAIAAANASYPSDANIQALIKALNDAIAKGDTAAIKNATAALNSAVDAKKKAEPQPASVKLTKTKYTIKRGKSAKIKYSKTTDSSVTFKKKSGKSFITVSKGKIKVKSNKSAKKAKGKTYKVKVTVSTKATAKYKAFKKTYTVKVKIK